MKSAYEMNQAKAVTVISLNFDGKQAGKIVAIQTSAGCTATIGIWAGPLAELPGVTGRARHGYLNDAIINAVDSVDGKRCVLRNGKLALATAPDSEWSAMLAGATRNVQGAFEGLGYEYTQLL